MTTHEATCHCGQLKAICEGDPVTVAMCHCNHCQRRTGTAFNLGAWFPSDAVRIEGGDKTFSRPGDRDISIDFHFCPECGTSLWWESPANQGYIGVAAGCFTDPDYATPTMVVFDEKRFNWVQNPEGVPCFATAPD